MAGLSEVISMRSSLRSNSRLFVFVFLLAPLGCGKGHQVAPVSGRVELDHKPLAHATVTFAPLSGKNLPISSGLTDEQGNFKLVVGDATQAEGAVVGEHRVSISLDTRNQEKKVQVKHMQQLEMLPTKYNLDSTLKFTVPPGGTKEANFLDLKSDDPTKSSAPPPRIIHR
jgi:hypothetical protein